MAKLPNELLELERKAYIENDQKTLQILSIVSDTIGLYGQEMYDKGYDDGVDEDYNIDAVED